MHEKTISLSNIKIETIHEPKVEMSSIVIPLFQSRKTDQQNMKTLREAFDNSKDVNLYSTINHTTEEANYKSSYRSLAKSLSDIDIPKSY